MEDKAQMDHSYASTTCSSPSRKASLFPLTKKRRILNTDEFLDKSANPTLPRNIHIYHVKPKKKPHKKKTLFKVQVWFEKKHHMVMEIKLYEDALKIRNRLMVAKEIGPQRFYEIFKKVSTGAPETPSEAEDLEKFQDVKKLGKARLWRGGVTKADLFEFYKNGKFQTRAVFSACSAAWRGESSFRGPFRLSQEIAKKDAKILCNLADEDRFRLAEFFELFHFSDGPLNFDENFNFQFPPFEGENFWEFEKIRQKFPAGFELSKIVFVLKFQRAFDFFRNFDVFRFHLKIGFAELKTVFRPTVKEAVGDLEIFRNENDPESATEKIVKMKFENYRKNWAEILQNL